MTINCLGQLIDLTVPKVMGIVNLTPDSFYDGNRYHNPSLIVSRVESMLSEGAAMIDLGAASSRPGAATVSEQEELQRLMPVVTLLLREFPNLILSVDTYRSAVAKQCLNAGVALINDISAGLMDQHMLQVIADHQVPYIMMHMRGTPQTMTQLTQYDNLVKEMRYYFSERIAAARALGINDLIIDPGFGFAKTVDQNYELLQQLELFQQLDVPVLVGLSRKSMVYKVIDETPEEALNGTTALHMVALQKGASILRVHDVREAVQCIRLHEKLRETTK